MWADQLEGIIFDVDGTMYRQFPVRARMAMRLLVYCAARPLEGATTLRLIRAYRKSQESLRDTGSSDDQLRLACERACVDPAWGSTCVASWVHERPLDLISRAMYPDLLPFLERAARRGLRLAVFSDYPAESKLRALQIGNLFDCVLDASDPRVRKFKPAPNGIVAVLTRLEIQPRRALYIGDRPSVDGQAACRAGVRCVIIGCPLRCCGVGWRGVPDYHTLGRLLGLP